MESNVDPHSALGVLSPEGGLRHLSCSIYPMEGHLSFPSTTIKDTEEERKENENAHPPHCPNRPPQALRRRSLQRMPRQRLARGFATDQGMQH